MIKKLFGNLKNEFTPKLFVVLDEGISKEQLFKDIFAGIITGIVAIPLAIAFAIASGVSPEKGLLTAFIAGFIISFLGGSRVQIGGPTEAFVVIVYGIVEKYGINGLIFSTFFAGLLLILFGFLRLGTLLKYFPYTVIVGFTTGIAFIIFSSQIKDFFGLNIGNLPSDFIEKWIIYIKNFNSINIYSVLIGVITIIIIIIFQRYFKNIPGSLVAIIVTTVIVKIFNFPVETIGSRFGDISTSSFKIIIPSLNFSQIKELLNPIISIALLGGIESLLSATVADGMIGGKHKPNIELVAQGVANCFSALFGGIPATGAIARTSTNVKNGGRTPIAGIVHAFVLFIVYFFAYKYVKLIPMACLAGILFYVSYNMAEFHLFFSMMKISKHDTIVLLITFFITVIFDLVLAIQLSMILSAFLFIKRVIDSSNVNIFENIIDLKDTDQESLIQIQNDKIFKSIIIYKIIGPFFFGQAQEFVENLSKCDKNKKYVILKMKRVPFIDATGIHRLKDIINKMYKEKKDVIIVELNENAKNTIIENIDNNKFKIFEDIDSFINYLKSLNKN